jgi:hypothetical protein
LSFIVNSGGIDAFRRKLKEITDGINPSTLLNGLKLLKKTANELCNESKSNPNPSKRVTNLSNSFNSTNFNFEIEDRELLDCLIIAIERNLNHMPEITRQVFHRLLVEFKVKRSM